MKLVEYFDKFKCDKGSLKHRYDRVYELTLEPIRNKEFNLLEIGIFMGASLEALVEYAPQAQLVGLDIFPVAGHGDPKKYKIIQPEDLPILEHPNVTWFRCDSTQPLSVALNKKFDIIIDDGSHTHDAQRKTFENLFPYLKEDGIYFIEDVWPFALMNSKEKQHYWLKNHPNDWTDQKYARLLETIAPYNVTFHDIREGYTPDTFIIEVRK